MWLADMYKRKPELFVLPSLSILLLTSVVGLGLSGAAGGGGWCLQLSHIISTLGLEFIGGHYADNHSRFIIFLNNYPSAQWCCLSSFRMLVQEIRLRGKCHLDDEINDGKFMCVEG